ncbi:MAG: hypothetical protein PHQ75_13815 [Thermoguttaceae bacterium]|nr:hypothetical protein [Thermoguttaceae bacterium]
MGGRGASSGIYGKNNEKTYGSEYRTVLQDGEIKFLERNQGRGSAPLETMTKGRIYATLDSEGKVGYITYYDETGKKFKQIDVDKHEHFDDGVSLGRVHTHMGYLHDENGSRKLTEDENILVQRVLKKWEEYKNVR